MLKINSLDKSLKFNRNILLKNREKYTGNLFMVINNKKSLCLSYNSGLLQSCLCRTENNKSILKKYEYNNQNNLINVKRNGKDIFTKNITHNIGINYTRDENINGIIRKTYDAANRLTKYIVSSKLIFGFIEYFENMSIDTRYFLNQAKYLGNGRIHLKYPQGDPILNNGIIDKIILRDFKRGSQFIARPNGQNLSCIFKSADGTTKANANYLTDKNGNPLWSRISGANDKWSYEKKVQYDDFGHKVREIINQHDRFFTENIFDKNGNIIQSRQLNSNGDTIQTTKSQYNRDNLLIKKLFYDKNNRLVERTIKTYHPNKSLKTSEITHFDKFGQYKSIYEYDENNLIVKLTEINNNSKTETFYDKNEQEIRFVERNKKNRIKYIREQIYDDLDLIKTLVKNGDGSLKYQIEHFKEIKEDKSKNINVFKTPIGKLIGKEFIICNNETGDVKLVFTNEQGKRIKLETLCELVGDEI